MAMSVLDREPQAGTLDELYTAVPDLFRLVLEQSATALCLVGVDGRFLTVNAAVCSLLGRSREELLRITFQELTHQDDVDRDVAQVRRVMAGEIDTYRLAKRYVHPDGAIIYGHLTVTGVRDASGRLLCFISQILDVTGATLAQEAARIAQEQLRGVIDSQLDPWVLLNAIRDADGSIIDFRYMDANEAACSANNLDRNVLLRTTLLELFPEHATSGLLEQYAAVVTTGDPLALDDYPFHSLERDGRTETRFFDNRATKVDDGISFTWRDVTARVRQRQRLADRAFCDPLTGLANRARLDETLIRAQERRRPGGLSAVLYGDLDRFKPINDTLGHEAGDIVLMAVAERMRAAVRRDDLVARIGGDEFVVVLENLSAGSDALALAETISLAVSHPISISGVDVVPSISIGVALAENDEDLKSTLRRADIALYQRKSERRESAPIVSPGSRGAHG